MCVSETTGRGRGAHPCRVLAVFAPDVSVPTHRACSSSPALYCATPVSHAFRISRPHSIESLYAESLVL